MRVHKKSIINCSFLFLLAFLLAAVFPNSVQAAETLPDITAAQPGDKTVYGEQTLVITKARFAADSFNGVAALYRPGRGDGSNAVYSCAAYVKRYYKTVYGLTVNNLYSGRIPNVVGGSDSFVTVLSPAPGDIAAAPGHWAIVKSANSNGTVTLIEQNWKWQQGGKTVTKINRVVKNEQLRFLRLKSVQALNEADVQNGAEDNGEERESSETGSVDTDDNGIPLPTPEVVVVVQEP